MGDKNLSTFREMIEALRPFGESARAEAMSPLATAMAREVDGSGLRVLKSIYVAGGLPAVADASADIIAQGGMTPWGLVSALESIADIHERDSTSAKDNE